jgi:hypothetical protein
MKAKNTYNSTQLNYLERRITTAVRRKQEEIYEVMSKRIKDECKKYPEISSIDRGAAIVKAILAKHPTLDKSAVATFICSSHTLSYSNTLSNALKPFSLKRGDVDPALANEKKCEEIEKRNGAEAKVKEKKLEAIRQEAMDAIYLGDQSDLENILKTLDSVSV